MWRVSGVESIIIVVLAALTFTVIFFTPFYIAHGVGLMKIAKREKIEYPWFAWIPVCASYLLGKCAHSNKLTWALVVTSVISIFTGIGKLMPVPEAALIWKNVIIGTIYIITLIINVIAANSIYKRYSKNSGVMTVFSILSLGLLVPIFLFAIRNNKIKM